MMLSINKRSVTRHVSMSELFTMVNHEVKPDHTTNIRHANIEVLTDTGWQPIAACYTTEPLIPGIIKFSNGSFLECADKHLVYTNFGWKYVRDLEVGNLVETDGSYVSVTNPWTKTSDTPIVMGDIQIDSKEHSYYTNGILSHNTHALVQLGASALMAGKNVFHYSMELNERMVGIRYDSNLTNISSTDCFDAREAIKTFFEENKDVLGRLYIKEFPTRTITTSTLRAHIEKMGFKGIRPDLVIVDYAGIMRSTEKYDLPRFELQCIIQELRAFAREMGLPIWTALQSNKEGAKSEIIDVTNMAESYGQAAEADLVLGLQRLSTQKATGYGTLFVAKNRFGIDGVQYKIHLDTSRSRLRVLTDKEIEDAQLDVDVSKEQMSADVLASFKKAIADRKAQFTKLGPKEEK